MTSFCSKVSFESAAGGVGSNRRLSECRLRVGNELLLIKMRFLLEIRCFFSFKVKSEAKFGFFSTKFS